MCIITDRNIKLMLSAPFFINVLIKTINITNNYVLYFDVNTSYNLKINSKSNRNLISNHFIQ